MEGGALRAYKARSLGDGTLMSKFAKARALYGQRKVCKEAYKYLDELIPLTSEIIRVEYGSSFLGSPPLVSTLQEKEEEK